MRSDTSRLPLALAAVAGGLVLFVAGFVIAAQMRSAVASPATMATGGGCYTNWNGNTCSAGYTAVSVGEWTGIIGHVNVHQYFDVGGLAFICASQKAELDGVRMYLSSDTNAQDTNSHQVNDEVCAICCASSGVVGGIGELPPIAGIGGSPSYNYAVAAVLAFVAVVAFAAGGWYARRRWLG
jgi:hypothetical protein